jgi:hypothetical protein
MRNKDKIDALYQNTAEKGAITTTITATINAPIPNKQVYPLCDKGGSGSDIPSILSNSCCSIFPISSTFISPLAYQ